MNDVKKEPKHNKNKLPKDSEMDAEMQELRREMQSAKATAWAQKNQQKLMVAVVVVVVGLFGASLWLENNKSQRHAAATLYHQAVASGDQAQRKVLLENIISDYNDSGYSSLAHLQLAKGDDVEVHLTALMRDSSVPKELAWQARLDLAEVALNKDDLEAAKSLLSERTGKQYEQLRFYLLSQTTTVTSEKQIHLQKALDAISNDNELKNKIEGMLSALMDTVNHS